MSIKLIIALDFKERRQAFDLVEHLNPEQCALKVGSEMFTLFGNNFVKALIARQFKVFLDLKFHDIPNTVARACQAVADLGVWMMNVHASGGLDMMLAAKKALLSYSKDRPLLIAVTLLTSLREEQLASLGIERPLMTQALKLAELAYTAELDGVVCSAFEASMIKQATSSQFITVTPGIRLAEEKDDQARVMSPQQALHAGSDYLVIGRPVTRATNPAQVVQDLLLKIQTASL